MFKTLYGKNKDGSYKVWSISVEGNTITITHGKENGKMQTKIEVVAGKNTGRANATSPEQQALLEAHLAWQIAKIDCIKDAINKYTEDVNHLGVFDQRIVTALEGRISILQDDIDNGRETFVLH